MKIIIASNNNNKIREYKEYFNEYEVLSAGDFIENFEVIEDGKTYKENSEKKAQQLYDMIEKKYGRVEYPIIGDDSGLSIDALGGNPGVYSRRYWTKDGSEGEDDYNNVEMIKALKKFEKPWTCKYEAMITLILNGEKIYCCGICCGQIIEEGRGENGFAYDKHFEIDGKTVAELTMSEKNKISHRGLAADEVKKALR